MNSERRPDYYSVMSGHKLTFSAAHFVCQEHWREPLHGHNYKIEFYAEGLNFDQQTGFLCDFLEVEKPLREIILEFKQKMLIPMESPFLKISEENGHITCIYNETKTFMFPSEDCFKLPTKYASCEDFVQWIMERLLDKLGEDFIKERRLTLFRLTLFESKARNAAITKHF